MIVDELIAILGFDLKGEGDLDRFNKGIKSAEANASGFVAMITKAGVLAAGAFAAIGGAAALGRLGGGLFSGVTATSAEFEKFEATLTTIEGSAEKAKSSLNWIGNFAATTPYEMGELTEAFVKMRAYGLDPMDGSFKAIGDAASGMGKGFMQGVEAIADAVTGENERLKEFGIRSSIEGDKVTYRWTQNGKEMSKTVKKSGPEIQAAIMGIFSRFDGAMEAQSRTWDGMVSNMSDRWTMFLKGVGDKGYFEDVKRRFRDLSDTVNGWSDSGAIDRTQQFLSDAMIGVMNYTERAALFAYRLGRGFYFAADGVADLTSRVTGLSKDMAGIGMGAALLGSTALGRGMMMAVARRVPAVAALLALEDIMAGLNGDESFIGSTEEGQTALDNLKKRFDDLKGSATNLADSLGSVRQQLVTSLNMPPEAFSTWDDATARWEAFKAEYSKPITVAGFELGSLEGMFKTVEGWATNAATNFRLLFTDPAALIQKLMIESVDRVAGLFERIAGAFDALANPIDTIKSAVQSLMDVIKGAKAFFDSITGGEVVAQEVAPRVEIGGNGTDTIAPAPVPSSGGSDFTAEAEAYRDALVNAEVPQSQTGGLTPAQANDIALKVMKAGAWVVDQFDNIASLLPGLGAGGGTSDVNAAATQNAVDNLAANVQAMGAKEVTQSVTSTIAPVDQRDQSQHVSVSAPITVNVEQATQAPAAVGGAISNAVRTAATPPARITGGPSAP